MGAYFASMHGVMSSRAKGTDKKTGFDLLEHVTGGVHISTGPYNDRVVHRPLDDLNDAQAANWNSAADDSRPPPTTRKRDEPDQ
jgi:hypothetical protein